MENEKKPTIKFVARAIYGKIYMKPACQKSTALCELTSKHPRSTLEPSELPVLARMGFDIDVSGDMKEFKAEIKRIKELEER